MKIFVTGHTGKIGQRLVELGALPVNFNLTDKKSIETAVKRIAKTDLNGVVVHCAAISSIDECEKDYEKALAVNTWGTGALCDALLLYGITRMVLLSSEQVFYGFWGNYKENANPKPVNKYGMTKLGAEVIAEIWGFKTLRLSRVVSAKDTDIERILLGGVSVPTFIKRSYSHIDFAARFIWQYATRYDEMPKILHYGGERRVSFYDLAKRLNPDGVTARWRDDKNQSPRPFNCGLNTSLAKKLGLPIQHFDAVINSILREDEL